MSERRSRGPAALDTLTARTLSVAASLFLMTAAFILVKTGRDALYFEGGMGVHDLPKAYIAIAFLSLPVAYVILGLMRHLGARRARLVAPLALCAALALFHGVARPGGGALMTSFFVSVPLAFGVLFSLTWLLGADLFDGVARERLARAYSVVGAASILGGMVGGLVARALAFQVEPRTLILVGAVVLAASAGTTALAQSRFPAASFEGTAAPRDRAAARVAVLLTQRYPLLLLLVGMVASLVGILVEFQLYLAAATSGQGGRENASFFASVYVVLNASALGVQLYAMPLLQKRIGVGGSLLVLPAVLVGGATVLLGAATSVARSLLRVAEGGLKASIHRVNWEQAYLPLNPTQRAVAKLVVDGAAARVAEGVAAAALLAWLHFVVKGRDLVGQDTSWITYTLLLASFVWMGASWALARALTGLGATDEAALRFDIPLPDT